MKSKAFTLVELAIVLIIIGLITGGVIGAQSLIESSNRQAIIKDIRSFSTAINAFQLEYDALPGDFTEAEDYWGISSTMDGNGDGIISFENSNVVEDLGIWNHLGLAEILDQEFEDFSLSTYDATEPWLSLPNGSIDGTYWVLDVFLTHSFWSTSPLHNSNLFSLVKIDPSDNYQGFLQEPSMASKEIYKIDKKIDDGLPFAGSMGSIAYNLGGSALNTYSTDCHESGSTLIEREYNLQSDEKVCVPVFILQSQSGKFSSLF